MLARIWALFLGTALSRCGGHQTMRCGLRQHVAVRSEWVFGQARGVCEAGIDLESSSSSVGVQTWHVNVGWTAG